MESLGYLMGAVAWGAPVAVLLMGVRATIVVGRWRRRTIAALERAELDADVPQSAEWPATTSSTQTQLRKD